MAMLFGVAQGNPAATIAGRVAYQFAWRPDCKEVLVWRGPAGLLHVAPHRGQKVQGEVLAVYGRDVRIADIVDDVREFEPGATR